MDSRTKHRLDRGQLEAVVRSAFGAAARVLSATELTAGMFNASYALKLDRHPPVVLKVAPPPGVPLMTYEANLMRTEVDFYARVSRETTCPVPRVLAQDFTRSVIPSDFFFMEKLQGQPLDKAKKDLSRQDLARIKTELGEIIGRLGAIRGDRFGYPQVEAGAQAPTWREAFLRMVSNVLADAERFGVTLPRSTRELRAIFEALAGALDEVTVPTFTHFDLWEGNVFIHRPDGAPRIEALIDGERAFWGDPHAELVSAALFRDLDHEPDLVRGYEAATGKPLERTQGLRDRLTMYRTYLYLIMVIEGTPRGYSGVQHAVLRRYFEHKLKTELRRLEARAGGNRP